MKRGNSWPQHSSKQEGVNATVIKLRCSFSYGFPWIPMDSYGFPWIPMDSYGILIILQVAFGLQSAAGPFGSKPWLRHRDRPPARGAHHWTSPHWRCGGTWTETRFQRDSMRLQRLQGFAKVELSMMQPPPLMVFLMITFRNLGWRND